MTRHRKEAPFPSREQVLEFIRTSPGTVNRRDIARAFHIRGADRQALRHMLRELQEEGLLGAPRHRRYAAAGELPPVTVVRVSDIDGDGELLCRPERDEGGPAPRIYLSARKRVGPAPGVGDRLLARLRRIEDGVYEATILHRLEPGPGEVLGVFTPHDGGGGRVLPTDRRNRREIAVAGRDAERAAAGDLVRVELRPGHRHGQPHGRIAEVLGKADSPATASLIAIGTHGIPDVFSRDALAQAEAARPAPMGRRTDLTEFTLVTIDDEDARDFDDAVWAAPDDSPDNEGGWHLLVAIADVSWYVRPGDALDRAARERGNSVYFPDRVVPMLPEALSNGLCSLKPGEPRPCMAVHMWIDRNGTKLRHRFLRGMMRSAARLTYRQVQEAADGAADSATDGLAEPVLRPLYGAYGALRDARTRRGAIDLDLPERRIRFDRKGQVIDVEPRARFDSHRLIEEFMILANVCAAETLETKRGPCMYRVHDSPPPDKLEALREVLADTRYRLVRGQVIRPQHFNRLMEKAAGSPDAQFVAEAILRSQSQAVYSPGNIGHFGLGLRRYAHFTSPIRRYADLLVHRALIAVLGFGEGGLPDGAESGFTEIGEHISTTERRAALAERDTVDRLTAAYLADRIGTRFAARISSVTRFGLFVSLDDSGASGLIPMSMLGDERFHFDARRQTISGAASGHVFRMGDPVRVELVSADFLTGSLAFSIARKTPVNADAGTSRGDTPRRRRRRR